MFGSSKTVSGASCHGCTILCPKLRVNKDEEDDGWLCHWMYDSGWPFGDLKSTEMLKNGGEEW